MKFARGKQILVMGLVVLVIAAGYYRWTQEAAKEAVPVTTNALPSDVGQESKEENNYFSQAKRERNAARDESVELLRSTIESESATADAKASAEQKVEQAATYIERERIVENLVKAKGYGDCVVFLDAQGANVIVKAGELKAEDVAIIKDIVMAQTGVKPSEIRISSKN